MHCRFKRIDAAYKQVAAVIDTLITQKIEEVSADGYDVQSEKGDVFTRLVHAHVNGEGSAKLTLDRDELVSFGVLFLLSFVRWALQKFDALLVSMHTDWKRVHYALRWAR